MVLLRSVFIISFMTLALSSPGNAVCGPGNDGCEPSADETRTKVERLLNAAFLTPYSIVSLDKLDGRSVETKGRKMYEMRISAVFNYSGDKLRCRTNLCPSCIIIWWRSTRPQKKRQSRVGSFLNLRDEVGARTNEVGDAWGTFPKTFSVREIQKTG